MDVGWYTLDQAALPPGIVLIDATQGAAPFWDTAGPILGVLEELRDRLPASACPTVVPLGSRHSHPLNAVLGAIRSGSLGGAALDRQLVRFPVVGPSLREWIRTPPGRLLLITNTPVRDLDDWLVPEVTGALLVYRLTGMDRVTPDPVREVGPEADLASLAEHLHDPLAEARVGGPAFAVDWGEADSTWTNGALRTAGGGPAGPVLLSHPDGHRPSAELRRASGVVLSVRLTPSAAPPERRAVPVPPEAGSVLRVWQAGQPFFCPACRAAHPPGRLTCSDGSGHSVIAPLAAASGTAWLLRHRNGWAATPFPRGLYPLPDGCVASCRSGGWEVFECDAGAWARSAPADGLVTVDEDTLLMMN